MVIENFHIKNWMKECQLHERSIEWIFEEVIELPCCWNGDSDDFLYNQTKERRNGGRNGDSDFIPFRPAVIIDLKKHQSLDCPSYGLPYRILM